MKDMPAGSAAISPLLSDALFSFVFVGSPAEMVPSPKIDYREKGYLGTPRRYLALTLGLRQLDGFAWSFVEYKISL